MSVTAHVWSEDEQRAIREQVDRILASDAFAQSRRRQTFLSYIVDETLAGRGDRLKGYTVAIKVFDRGTSFDPALDPVVRIEAGRLRDKLSAYYAGDGASDPVRIDLPKGSYTPVIAFRHVAGDATAEPPLEATPSSSHDDSAAVPVDDRAARVPIWSRWPEHLPRRLTSAAAVTLVAVLAIAAGLWSLHRLTPGPSLPNKPSIAVLPFDNIGRDPRWERLADGITEDIITDLSHSRDLIVIARSSTEVYKNKPIDIRRVGQDLNVKYVLEGSIQSSGERTRVTAQLIEAASGRHVWSERYDRHVDDLFVVQNEVTQRIAATLIGYQGAVAEAERSLLRRKPPATLTAYETYLLAMEAKHKVTKESLREAEGLFLKALQLDPQLARAYCGLATVQYYLIDLGLAPSVEEAVRKMTEAAENAVKFDPNDGLSHQVLGMAYAYQGKPEQSLAELDRAETLSPSDADMLLIIAWSLPPFGQSARAIDLAEKALALNPHHPDWYNQGFSFVYFFGEQYDKSIKYRLLVKEPLAIDYAFLAMAQAYLGRMREAGAAAANLMKLDPSWTAERYLSESGGYAEKEAELFVNGARKAGLPDCVAQDKLKDVPHLVRVASCDAQRSRNSG